MSDPRPVEFRDQPGFEDRARNCIINYCSNTNQDLTMKYLYEKADIQTAANDHHYLALPLTEYWVDKSLHVTEVSARILEINTRGQAQCRLWHSERKWRITASRFGEICNATERRNRQRLCECIVFPTSLSTPPIIHGKQYESVAIHFFESFNGVNVNKCGLYVIPNLPFLGASPDGTVGSTSIVEVKCPYTGRNSTIIPGKMFPFLEYTLDGAITLKKTSHYFSQVQGQMYLSQTDLCYFVVYTHQDLLVVPICLDKDLFLESMLPKLEVFYKKYLRPYIAGIF
ncbi:uncharacterized protein LOC121372425 isoform X2 [Gigantopelta aegis]|nr:uncharacterized protein LOC121372425 isoform X2 [Gigantopelta aegis]